MVESHVRLLLCAYFEIIDLVLRENSEHARELPWVAWWPSYSAPGWEPSFRLSLRLVYSSSSVRALTCWRFFVKDTNPILNSFFQDFSGRRRFPGRLSCVWLLI